MNIILLIFFLILIILIIYTIIDRYSFLINDKNNNSKINNNQKNNNYNKINNNEINNDEEINIKYLIKYSSIRNKLNTEDDYINFYSYLKTIENSIYISIIDTNIYNKNQIIELISNDIQKTRLKYNLNKLKNIYVIIKEINNYCKIILFYDGLIYNKNHFKFIKNDYSGNTIVYKLDLDNKIFNHHLQ